VSPRIELEGRSRRLGDDINTDTIISSTRKRDSLDPHVLKRYLLETVDPAFAPSVRPGDLIVAGDNFGCGSAMEVAATVIVAAGIKGVLARSFSRTYYRNAVNNGLIPIECDTSGFQEGDRVRVILTEGEVAVRNETKDEHLPGKPLPAILLDIAIEGGLVPYFLRYKDFCER
jgi:3-isopropylmalate/(R)-2-methylmalate dehydratase small subunit